MLFLLKTVRKGRNSQVNKGGYAGCVQYPIYTREAMLGGYLPYIHQGGYAGWDTPIYTPGRLCWVVYLLYIPMVPWWVVYLLYTLLYHPRYTIPHTTVPMLTDVPR